MAGSHIITLSIHNPYWNLDLNFATISQVMPTTSQIKREENGTIVLTIQIPAEKVKKEWDEELKKLVGNTTIQGFRKGKAPADLVEKQVNTEKLKEEVLRKLLPDLYLEAVKEHNLKPVITPKIHVEKMDEGKDWEFTASVVEAPEVKLGNYKDAVKKITAKTKIIIPGKEPTPPSFEELMQPILETVNVTIPPLLIEGEVDRLLSQLLDEVKNLGMTLEQYLSSTGKTGEQLRNDYIQKAENDTKLEFILQKIAEEEKITVEQKEIDEALQKVKDESERKMMEQNMYMLASILRQQKTLDFIKNL